MVGPPREVAPICPKGGGGVLMPCAKMILTT